MSLSDRLSRLMWLSHGGSKILMRLSRPMSLSDRISRRGTGMLMSLSDRLSRRGTEMLMSLSDRLSRRI